MAAAKRQQNSGVLFYILMTFLTIISTTFAVIYFVKFEERRDIADQAVEQLDKFANANQVRQIEQIVGESPRNNSYLQTIVDHIDNIVKAIDSDVPAESSITSKAEFVMAKIEAAMKQLYQNDFLDQQLNDPNSTSLTRVIDLLYTELKTMQDKNNEMANQFQMLDDKYQNAIEMHTATQEELNAKIAEYKQMFEKVRNDYLESEQLLSMENTQQVQSLRNDLKTIRAENEKVTNDIYQIQAELEMTKEMLTKAQAKVIRTMPLPDSNSPAYVGDGKVILVDSQARIVHINIGSDEGVYKGLTFSVYDKSVPLPKNGKGKAEVEVYEVEATMSVARITTPVNNRNPIIGDDIIGNIIWDKNQSNSFILAGDFQYAGTREYSDFVIKQGGMVDDKITVNTDYVILGNPPEILPRPTLEEQDMYPDLMAKYEQSLQRFYDYQNIESQAQKFSLPIFSEQRFLYFTGYKEMAPKTGAFN